MAHSGTFASYPGGWDESTRAVAALAFIEQYATAVDSLDLSGPFHAWYAPSATFYNSDGTIYHGGSEIWVWMQGLFGAFSAVRHQIDRILVFHEQGTAASLGKPAKRIILETKTFFTVKDLPPFGTPIVVPRLLQFLVGYSEVDGQGTGGMQILEAKVWWDGSQLGREMQRREAKGDSV